MAVYVVKAGDTVDSIAEAAGLSAKTVIWDNQIEYPYRLAVGQALFLEEKERAADRPEFFSMGYAYPYIDAGVLGETLPYLTEINVFSYGFTAEGNLVPPVNDDSWLIAEAWSRGVRPKLTLAALGPDGRFDNGLVTALIRDKRAQERLLWELGRTIEERRYGGLDIDFEYVLKEDAAGFAAFAGLAAKVMNLFGYPVSAALAPKTSADQRGLLYEGMDYRALGEAVNRVLLMTYEWGYSQGPPMAVAPLNMVRRVAEYAVTEIPPEKILLGIPNYGYDWALPYEQGVSRARTINTGEALRLAIDYGAEIRFDERAMSPYFRYWQYGVQHEVWFEDVRSIQAKFDLIREYGLLGAGYWQLMTFYRAGWLLMEERFRIRREGEEPQIS